MLTDRVLVILLLVPFGAAIFVDGGLLLVAGSLFLLNLAALEYAHLFARAGIRVAGGIVCVGSSGLVILRWLVGFDHLGAAICAIVFLAVLWHLLQYERGDDLAASGLTATLTGTIYLGWQAAYFLSLRQLPDGLWWGLIVLPAVWFADSAAYLVGSRWGRHPMTRRLSPKKTWEGYAGGIFFGSLAATLFAGIWHLSAAPESGVNLLNGLLVGLCVSALSPIGDLAISMLKRQMGAKDSGALLPGHGGALDRIDSWLVTAPIGYYAVLGIQMLSHWHGP
jgi:phosphatidate cytidylyltransferase